MKTYEYEGNIGIVGLSGSGKSTLGDALLAALGWSNILDIGQWFRDEVARMGKSVQEGDDLPLNLDRRVDKKTVDILRKNHKTILVGRTVSHLAKINRHEPAYFGVGVNASLETIAQRARPKWNEKKHLPEDTPLPTLEHVTEKILIRNAKDMGRYGILYKVTSEQQLYGAPPNDMVVWSDRMSVSEEVEMVLAKLYYLRKLTR